MDNAAFETAEERVAKWLEGYGEGMSAVYKRYVPMIKQLCRDLNEAHNEILRQQGVSESDFNKYDWPEWSPQANSIRWAEGETKTKLAKTDNWTLYPSVASIEHHDNGKTGVINEHDH
jgi:hypothetical protein